jgi:helix-turn-helix protein
LATVHYITDLPLRYTQRRGKKVISPKPQKFLTTEDVACRLRQSARTITEWACSYVESGGSEGIPGTRIGRRWLFDEAMIDDLLAGKRPVKTFSEARRA